VQYRSSSRIEWKQFLKDEEKEEEEVKVEEEE
jgi:hypothetical protein